MQTRGPSLLGAAPGECSSPAKAELSFRGDASKRSTSSGNLDAAASGSSYSSSSKRNVMLNRMTCETDVQHCKKARILNLDDMGLDKVRLNATQQVQPLGVNAQEKASANHGEESDNTVEVFVPMTCINVDDYGIDSRRFVKRRRTTPQFQPGLGKPGSLGIKPPSELSVIACASLIKGQVDAQDAPT